ncbi:hypothetical protein CBX98_24470 [Vibrio sp. T9]|uniref:hypothetical protein n=1 Tax=Vibrio sp. T9 TaxID=2007196 RepID=UPI000D650E43|nr:hypothetical protein [Vibrio sp. T9]PWF67217.1 hypothetical protein CBX98_24470 [Vibrio sp. T9]
MNKQAIALHRLDKAIQLYFDEQDYICALTLSGASEEILGKIVSNTGSANACEELVVALHQLTGCTVDEKTIRNQHMNWARNAVKHFNDNSEFEIDTDFYAQATQIIARCCTNIVKLGLPFSAQVERFLNKTLERT